MELADLRTFVAVVDEASFTRAGSRLGHTQPAVSAAIRRLESATGATLLIRGRRPVQLTAAGERLMSYARRMIVMDDQARVAIVNLRQIGRTGLVVGANDSLIGVVLPFFESFRQQRPGACVDLKRTRSCDVAGHVIRGELDVGLTIHRPEAEELERVLITHDELVVVVPPSHSVATRASVRLGDVAEQPLIAYNEPSPDRT